MQSLELTTSKPVIDRTGLAGNYFVEVYFAPAEFYRITTYGADQAILDRPSLKEALESELGLKFESSSAPVDVFTIKSVEKPSDN